VADVHHVISLGIGSPADIPHFILFGLSPTGPVSVEIADGEIVYVAAGDRTIAVSASERTITVAADDRSIVVPVRPTP
jgi:hypothetical protein